MGSLKLEFDQKIAQEIDQKILKLDSLENSKQTSLKSWDITPQN